MCAPGVYTHLPTCPHITGKHKAAASFSDSVSSDGLCLATPRRNATHLEGGLSFHPHTSRLSCSNHWDSQPLRVSRCRGPFAFLPVQRVLTSRRDPDRDPLRSHTLRSQGEPGWAKVGPETLLPRLQHMMAGICTHPCIRACM